MYKLLKLRSLTVIVFFILWENCLSQNQVSQNVIFDSKSASAKILFAQKKYSEAANLINSLILKNPEDGSNYFSRAVIDFSRNKMSTEVDTSLINDCLKAQNLGYSNAEANYLLFLVFLRNIDFLNFDHLTYESSTTLLDARSIDMLQTKEQIDVAVEKDRWNEKYLLSRIYLLGKLFNAKAFGINIYTSDLQNLENDCRYLARSSKDEKNRSKAHWYLSEIELNQRNDTLSAIKEISYAIDNTPNDFDLYYARGLLKLETNYCSGAISDFTTFINKKKILDNYQDAVVFSKRARCYHRLSQDSLAIRDYTISIKMYERAKTSIFKENNNLSNSKIQGINDRLGFCYFDRGVVYGLSGQYDKGCSDLNKAVDLGVTNANELVKKLCR